MNREELSTIAGFVESAREDTLQAAKSADRLHLTTAHMKLMVALDGLTDALEQVHRDDTAAELLEGIGT